MCEAFTVGGSKAAEWLEFLSILKSDRLFGDKLGSNSLLPLTIYVI